MNKYFIMKKVFFTVLLTVIFSFSQRIAAQYQEKENKLIERFINKKREFNRKYGYGFRIQLFNGSEVTAKGIRARFNSEYPDVKTYLSYRQPEWIIQIGHFKTRLEADRMLLALKERYRSAIIVPLGV